jgi:glutamate transport system ATP-binding protein
MRDAPTLSTQQPYIDIRHVSKRFGSTQALNDVSLAVHPGEVVAVVGPSGSGKSTLCRCINGLEKIDAGEIYLGNTLLPRGGAGLAAMRAQVGMVFQSFNLFPHMTVLRNITFAPMRVKRTPRAEAEQEARALLERVGLADKADAFPSELSGGQQQRAAIARSLAMSPQAMLFDEPTSALDPELIKEVLDVMVELARQGTTMVVVTHELGFAHEVADKIVFMDRGAVVEEEAPEIFFRRPRTERARTFLSTMLAHRAPVQQTRFESFSAQHAHPTDRRPPS